MGELVQLLVSHGWLVSWYLAHELWGYTLDRQAISRVSLDMMDRNHILDDTGGDCVSDKCNHLGNQLTTGLSLISVQTLRTRFYRKLRAKKVSPSSSSEFRILYQIWKHHLFLRHNLFFFLRSGLWIVVKKKKMITSHQIWPDIGICWKKHKYCKNMVFIFFLHKLCVLKFSSYDLLEKNKLFVFVQIWSDTITSVLRKGRSPVGWWGQTQRTWFALHRVISTVETRDEERLNRGSGAEVKRRKLLYEWNKWNWVWYYVYPQALDVRINLEGT